MWSNPITLTEHQTITSASLSADQIAGLDQYLDTVWQTRTLFYDDEPDQPLSDKQPFLTTNFDYKTKQPTLKAGRYVGF
ncbi:MAG: hypothetical protein EOO39_35925 [Cytophagaceae bacterium]|nr:MAG: hypothetical protein EOO39_35925 [Cytophagaceae bacterium]